MSFEQHPIFFNFVSVWMSLCQCIWHWVWFFWFNWHFLFTFELCIRYPSRWVIFQLLLYFLLFRAFLDEGPVFQSLISCYPFSRPSAIPGPVPDEIVAPATESIGVFQNLLLIYPLFCSFLLTFLCQAWSGVKLLLKMGWRRSRSINDQTTNSLYGRIFIWLEVWLSLIISSVVGFIFYGASYI